MIETETQWQFHGYQTAAGGQVVQAWYNGLSQDEKDEVQDVLVYLQRLPRKSWCEPVFEAFDPDISEVKIKVNVLKRIYRIYGTFWPRGKRYVYTFLLGKNKKKKNDFQGTRLARRRLQNLKNGSATIHEFEF